MTVDPETGAGVNILAAHPVAPGVRDNSSGATSTPSSSTSSRAGPTAQRWSATSTPTRDHAVVRRYESVGYVDAADQAGAGFVPTFPVGRTIPPVVAIDDVMMCSTTYVADTFEAVDITDADHRAVIATYRFR